MASKEIDGLDLVKLFMSPQQKIDFINKCKAEGLLT
jgi:hypothetical protein